jgi:hypothetical protein
MVAVEKESGVGHAGHSAVLRGGVRSTFLMSNRIHPTLLDWHERLSRTGTTCRKRISGIHGIA